MPAPSRTRTTLIAILLLSAPVSAAEPTEPPVRIRSLALQGAPITRPHQARIVRRAERWLALVEAVSGRKLPAEVRLVFRTSERRFRPQDIDRLAGYFGQPGTSSAGRLLAWTRWQKRATQGSSATLWADVEPFLCAFPLAGYQPLHQPLHYPVFGRDKLHERWLAALETPLHSFTTTVDFVVRRPTSFVAAYPASHCGVVVLADVTRWESGRAIVLHELAHWIDFATRDPALLDKGLPRLPTWDESFADVLAMAYLDNPCFSEDDTQRTTCYRRLDRGTELGSTPLAVTANQYADSPSSLRAQLWRRVASLGFEEVVADLFALREILFQYAQAALADQPPPPPTLEEEDDQSPRVQLERAIIQRAWDEHVRRLPAR